MPSPAVAEQLAADGANVPSLVSEDGEVPADPLPHVQLRRRTASSRSPAAAEEVRAIAGLPDGQVNLAGFGGQAADASEVFEGVDGALLLAALGVVVVILLLTYRSPVLWLLPII